MPRKEFNSYGITLLVTSFVMSFFTFGTARCFGIMLRALNDLHKLGQGDLNWIASLNAGCFFLLGPVAGIIQDKIGCRLTILIGSVLASLGLIASMFVLNLRFLYVTYGIVTGTGFCLVYVSSNIPINTYFRKKRIFAHSIAGIGIAVGIACMPYLLTFLLETYGWRGTFAVLSGLYLHCAVCGMLIRPKMQEVKSNKLIQKQEDNGQEKNSTLKDTKKILQNRHFIVYGASSLVIQHVYHVPHLLIPTVMASYGISPTLQSTYFTAVGISSTLQRVVLGSFLDKVKPHVLAVMSLSITLMGFADIGLAFVKTYSFFVTYGGIFGVFSGLYINLQTTTLVDIIGRDLFGLGFGYLQFLVGLGELTGAPIAGWLVDIRGKYDWVFYYIGSFHIFGGMLLLFLYLLKKYARRKEIRELKN